VIAYPAIDLRGGRAVQLVGGRPEQERVSWPDPLDTARHWVDAGFSALHVVDLDAALGTGDNRALIRELIHAVPVPVQVGGGVRDDETADALLAAGADRVIVGTRAIEDAAWLDGLARRQPDRVVVAADVRDDTVLTRGWTRSSQRVIDDFLASLRTLPLAGVLVTDVAREGRMAGIDGDLFARLAHTTAHALLAAGGIARMDDLRTLDRAGVAGAVLGMALYTRAIDGAAAAREFGP
jgi:phosphoribosylformimino-5-aminoimidazole carboxamide ribotide isomerase